jgi:DNA-directed RNA polymerase omega subunit
MSEIKEALTEPFGSSANISFSDGIDSVFLLVILAAQRNKQLLDGSLPRVTVASPKRKNISIALEEVQLGLVSFAGFIRRE